MTASDPKQRLDRLRQAGEALREIHPDERTRILGEVSRGWLRDDARRMRAAAAIAETTGYAPEMVDECLRRSFAAWSVDAIRDVVARATAGAGTTADGTMVVRATPPVLALVVLAQNTPGLAIAPVFTGLALGAPLILKPASGEPHFPELLTRSIAETDARLGAALDVWAWRGGDSDVEPAVIGAADKVIAYGGSNAIEAIRQIAPDSLIAHGPRVSLAVVGPLKAGDLQNVGRRIAEDVAFLDQRGCLSPQVVLAHDSVDREALGRAIATELERQESVWPRRALSESDAIAWRRCVDEAEAETMAGTATLLGGGPAPWAVAIEHASGTPLRQGPLDRFVRLTSWGVDAPLATLLRPLRGVLECVGTATDPSHRDDLHTTLIRAGATRVCPLGEMQQPPATWHSGGRPPGVELLSWATEPVSPVEKLADRFVSRVAQTSDNPRGLDVQRARGSWVYDRSGAAYLDLLAGIGVASIGHAHPEVARAVGEQARRFTHVMVYGEDALEPQVRLAERLTGRLGQRDLRAYFSNSGAEAIEGAIKLCRKATGRSRLLAFEGSFHGDTTGALALGGNPFYREPFRPLVEPVEHLPWDDMAALERIDDTVAAVFAEPVQAEGGVRVPHPDFLPALARRCREVGALLVLDEVVTAFGRTGRWFAHEHWPDSAPDVLVLAKALGGGLPLGAFLAAEPLMRTLAEDPPLGHVTTFGGNPVCCAAALASIDVIEREDLPARAHTTGQMLRDGLRPLVDDGLLADVRGIGMLIGLEFHSPEETTRFADACFDERLLVGWTLHRDTVIRLAPPLTLRPDERDHAITTLTKIAQNLRR